MWILIVKWRVDNEKLRMVIINVVMEIFMGLSFLFSYI
jgi:hypothetical protein